MYSQEKIQQATDEIIFALEKRQLTEHSINQYRVHYQKLNAYIRNEKFISIDENILLEFLRCQYNVHVTELHARGLDRVAGGHIRPLAILHWYLVTGEIDSRARVRNPPFSCPEGFCDSYESFMEYLRQKGLSYSTIHNCRETAQHFIRHMVCAGIEASDMISPASIGDGEPKEDHKGKSSQQNENRESLSIHYAPSFPSSTKKALMLLKRDSSSKTIMATPARGTGKYI